MVGDWLFDCYCYASKQFPRLVVIITISSFYPVSENVSQINDIQNPNANITVLKKCCTKTCAQHTIPLQCCIYFLSIHVWMEFSQCLFLIYNFKYGISAYKLFFKVRFLLYPPNFYSHCKISCGKKEHSNHFYKYKNEELWIFYT